MNAQDLAAVQDLPYYGALITPDGIPIRGTELPGMTLTPEEYDLCIPGLAGREQVFDMSVSEDRKAYAKLMGQLQSLPNLSLVKEIELKDPATGNIRFLVIWTEMVLDIPAHVIEDRLSGGASFRGSYD